MERYRDCWLPDENPVTKLIEVPPGIQPSGWGGAFGSRYAQAFQVLNQNWGQLIGGGMTKNSEGKSLIDPATGLYAQVILLITGVILFQKLPVVSRIY